MRIKGYISLVDYDQIVPRSDRMNLPWCRLYSDLHENPLFQVLSVETKVLYYTLMQLALKTHNRIPYKVNWLKTKACIEGSPDVEALEPEFIAIDTVVNDKAPKFNYGPGRNVMLTELEHAKLGRQLGDLIRDEYIKRLDAYKEKAPKKFAVYVRHYMVIKKWFDKDNKYVVTPPLSVEDQNDVDSAMSDFLKD